MKKSYLLPLFVGITTSIFSQSLVDLDANLPLEVKQRHEAAPKTISYSLDKNNSYDGPLSIEASSVDPSDVEHLEYVYEYSYTSAGKLTQITTKNPSLVNVSRQTYNFTWYGKTSSIVNESWNGTDWDFTTRMIYEYTAGHNLNLVTYQSYNSVTFDWETTEIDRYNYVGGETTPSRVFREYTLDGVNWTGNVAIDYLYTGSTPNQLEISFFDDNYLLWVPSQKWHISNWGNLVFSADYLFDNDYDLLNLTDQRVGKVNNFQFYPASFTNLYGFTTTNWTYTDSIGYAGIMNGTQFTDMYLIDFPGGVADTVEWDIFYYDQCYGYSGTVAKTKNMLGEWEIANGTYYDGQTVAYGNSCYVTQYDRYSNMNPMSPSGVRNYHWVINQASNLGTEEMANANILAYPNPVNNELTVNLGEVNAYGVVLHIYALDGTQISSFNCDSQIVNVNTSELQRGVYLLTINTQEGEFVKKFIKN